MKSLGMYRLKVMSSRDFGGKYWLYAKIISLENINDARYYKLRIYMV